MKTYLRISLLFVALFAVYNSYCQGKYKLINSEVTFFSEAPLEDIKAKNTATIGVIDVTPNSYLFRVPIKEFVFDKSLMQTHFNENYMESDEFPHGTFKGNIQGEYDLTKDGDYPVTASGELKIHGVVQKRNLPATLKVSGGKISLKSKFTVKLEDHDIEIPTIVFNKIAEEVEVTITSDLVKL